MCRWWLLQPHTRAFSKEVAGCSIPSVALGRFSFSHHHQIVIGESILICHSALFLQSSSLCCCCKTGAHKTTDRQSATDAAKSFLSVHFEELEIEQLELVHFATSIAYRFPSFSFFRFCCLPFLCSSFVLFCLSDNVSGVSICCLDRCPRCFSSSNDTERERGDWGSTNN